MLPQPVVRQDLLHDREAAAVGLGREKSERLAELAGLGRNYIGQIERAERNVALVNIVRIAKALENEPAEVFVAFTPARLAKVQYVARRNNLFLADELRPPLRGDLMVHSACSAWLRSIDDPRLCISRHSGKMLRGARHHAT